MAHLFSGAHPAHKTEPEFTSQQGPSPRDHEEKETTKVSLAWEDPGRQNGEGFWKEEMSELRPKGSREFESILSPEGKKKTKTHERRNGRECCIPGTKRRSAENLRKTKLEVALKRWQESSH